jgi:hypothetical protein
MLEYMGNVICIMSLLNSNCFHYIVPSDIRVVPTAKTYHTFHVLWGVSGHQKKVKSFHEYLLWGHPSKRYNHYEMTVPVATFWKIGYYHWEFSMNLWARILGDCLVNRSKLVVVIVLSFLWTHLSWLLGDMSFNKCLQMRFQHDGTPPRYNRTARQWLSGNCSRH